MLLLLINTLLDTFGWSFVLPALPKLHEIHHIQHSTVGMLMSTVSAISFIMGPILCKASDTYGRIPFLIINSFGSLLGLLICMTAKHQYWFIVGRILPALFKCGMGVPNAYVSDVSLTSLELTTNLGRLQAAMALGLILGPVIGGYFAKYDVNLPLMFSSVALILSMIFLLYVKESKSKGVSKDKPQRRPSTTTLTHDLTSLSRTQLLHMKFAFQVGNAMFELFLVPYVRRQLHLGEHHIGYVLGFYGLIALISNALVVQLAAKFSATHLLMVVFLHSIGLLGWGMSQHIVLTLVAITIIAITSCLYLNIVQTLIAELGNSSNAGATMGISSTVDRAARIIAPLIGGFALQESSPVSIGVAAFGFGVYSAAVLAYSSSSSALKERRKVE